MRIIFLHMLSLLKTWFKVKLNGTKTGGGEASLGLVCKTLAGDWVAAGRTSPDSPWKRWTLASVLAVYRAFYG